jgi:hypothetical protein
MTARGMKSGRQQGIRPASSSSKRTNILAGIAFVLVLFVVVTNVILPLLSEPNRTVPDELVGRWTTTAEAYADRAFEVSKTSVLFRTGPGENDFNYHEIKEVTSEAIEAGAILYTFVYSDDLEFLFRYEPVRDVIRFANQLEMSWTRQDSSPTTLASLPTTPTGTAAPPDTTTATQVAEVTQPVDAVPEGTQSNESASRETPGQTEQLIREVFAYRASGRDPFASLLESSDVRPLAQDLRVTTITYDPRYPSASVATLRDTIVGQRYSVRIGDELGRMRVAEISPLQVVLILSEFGSERQVVLRQVRRKPRTVGGGP